MDLEITILSEVNQKERQISYDITYMWTLKRDINEFIYETETDSENRLVVVGVGGWIGSLGLTIYNYYI